MLRFYRENISDNLYGFEITIKESNLFIKTCLDLKAIAFEKLYALRKQIEKYIANSKEFLVSLSPVKYKGNAPYIVKRMVKVSSELGVGPMACVAGAISQEVGKELLKYCDTCFVENGGDIFLKTNTEVIIGLYVGEGNFLNKLNIKLKRSNKPYGVCTSSAKIGPSLSLGSSDITMIVSNDSYFSDALATVCGNIINSENDLEKALNVAKKFTQTTGCCFICNNNVALWGDIELVGG